MTAPLGCSAHLARPLAVDATAPATEFGCDRADAGARVVYADRRIRVVELRPSPHVREAGGQPCTSTGHHVVLAHRGVVECRGDRAPAAARTADPANALLLNPGDRFRLTRPEAVETSVTVVTLAPELVARLFDPTDAHPAGDTRRFRAGRVLLHPSTLLRIHRLRRAWHAGSPGSALVETLADFVWAPEESRAEPPERGARARHEAIAEAMRRTLAAAPAATHRLDAAAATLGISSFHLAHVFRRHVGVSPHRYLLQLRLAIAVGEMLTGDVSLSTLAFDLGFSSHSHFTTVFRKFFGMTPNAARAGAARARS